MTLSRNLILALTVIGSAAVAAVAAVLAVRRHARRLEAAQHKTDLQTWESEGGSPVLPAVVKPPS
jgi:hypothetical protein